MKETSISHEDEEEDEGDDEGKKWRPLPPPNMDSILRQMPLTPMTLEELCAPSSDEEEEEEREKKEEERGEKSLSSTKERESSTSSAHLGRIDPCSSARLRDSGVPPLSTSTSYETAEQYQRSRPHTVSDYISSFKANHQQHSSDSKQSIRKFSNKKANKSNNDVIDLTEQSAQQPSTSDLNFHSKSQNLPSSSGSTVNSQDKSATKADLYELQDDDDFDVLCRGVDLNTIGDFSDAEPEATEPRIEQTTYTKTSAKGKSRASPSDQPIKMPTGMKRPNEVGISSRSKQSRLDTYREGTAKTNNISGSNKARDITTPPVFPSNSATAGGHSGEGVQRHTTPRGVPVSREIAGCDRISQRNSITNRSATAMHSGTGSLITTGQSAAPKLRESSQSSRPQSVSREIPAVHSVTDVGTGGHHTSGSSSVGRGGRVTPLGSQLTTDNCPMCDTKFPSWWVSLISYSEVISLLFFRYEQVDADGHIAKCLQAVMDLEMENNVVLL